jgi:drug/metabolite transporter (DMT)-like permease
MKIDWKRKLTSRKLWMAVAGFICGVLLIFTAGATEETITGAVMSFGSVVAYILGEGLADAAHTSDTVTLEGLEILDPTKDETDGSGHNHPPDAAS